MGDKKGRKFLTYGRTQKYDKTNERSQKLFLEKEQVSNINNKRCPRQVVFDDTVKVFDLQGENKKLIIETFHTLEGPSW